VAPNGTFSKHFHCEFYGYRAESACEGILTKEGEAD
jgi:hypothetical protein